MAGRDDVLLSRNVLSVAVESRSDALALMPFFNFQVLDFTVGGMPKQTPHRFVPTRGEKVWTGAALHEVELFGVEGSVTHRTLLQLNSVLPRLGSAPKWGWAWGLSVRANCTGPEDFTPAPFRVVPDCSQRSPL